MGYAGAPKHERWQYSADGAARRLNQEKVMSRAVSSAPWGLARWCLAVAPIPLGGGGTRTTASCTRKCSEHEIPRQPVTSGASAACARRGAEVLPATTAPPRPVQQPPVAALCGGCCSRRPQAPLALPAATPIIAIQTWRIGEAWSGPYDRTDCMKVLSPKFTCGTNRRERMAHTQ